MRKLASVLLLPLLGGSTSADFRCPEGSKVGTGQDAVPGGQSSFCLRDGVRHGEYAAWAPDGRQIIWGQFENGSKHGVWAMDVGTPESPEVGFVVFASDVDVTSDILDNPLPKCAEWNTWSDVYRSGWFAILSLLASGEMPGSLSVEPMQEIGVAKCLAAEARRAERLEDMDCSERDTQAVLEAIVAETVRDCILANRASE